MSSIPKELRYTKDHEWVRESDDPQVVEVGITDYAQGELGDVVFVDLPKGGASLKSHDVFGTIEAVKAVSELYSPVAGTVVESNKALEQDPALVNRDPYGQGWMVKVKVKDAKELEGLLRADAYAKHVGE
ncbi:MAG TPA: glycine cleavage system protein GcvH [Gemmatimonadales bacterium]|jgi:glycine cleavage system H protein|nr:glycine cleavage system protein GcvH [Gemmatimonadales bacterium]